MYYQEVTLGYRIVDVSVNVNVLPRNDKGKAKVVSLTRKYNFIKIHVYFYISNQFISNQCSGFLKITIEYNGLLLC